MGGYEIWLALHSIFGRAEGLPWATACACRMRLCALPAVTEFERIENRDLEMEYVEQSRLMMESRNGVKVAFHIAKVC